MVLVYEPSGMLPDLSLYSLATVPRPQPDFLRDANVLKAGCAVSGIVLVGSVFRPEQEPDGPSDGYSTSIGVMTWLRFEGVIQTTSHT